MAADMNDIELEPGDYILTSAGRLIQVTTTPNTFSAVGVMRGYDVKRFRDGEVVLNSEHDIVRVFDALRVDDIATLPVDPRERRRVWNKAYEASARRERVVTEIARRRAGVDEWHRMRGTM